MEPDSTASERTDVTAASRVLVLAYHFPPIGGGGVQRNLAMVRHLPACGYKPVVVTGIGQVEGRWTPPDPSLLEEVPDEVEIWRVAEPAHSAPSRWRRRAEKLLMARTPESRDWMREVLALAEHLPEVELLYASLVPYEFAQTAAVLAQRLGKPWVADLQDPWALDEMWLYPTGIQRRRDLDHMTHLLSSAAAIVMNTPEAVIRVRRSLPGLAHVPVVSIPNGFDPSLFEGTLAPAEGRRAFRIVHTGYFHTELGHDVRRTAGLRRVLRGMAIPVDILTRSPIFLLDALDRLRTRAPDIAAAVELHLAGVLSEHEQQLVSEAPNVVAHGYLSHRDSVALLRSADLLFLPMHNLPPGTRAGLVPGKTYEYLRSGRPILAAIPEGDARDMLATAPNAFLTQPDNAEEMAAVIEQQARQWQENGPVDSADPAPWRAFEHPRLVARMASLFDEVVGRVRER